jgi:SAM-dependent MidA family methyltransferase
VDLRGKFVERIHRQGPLPFDAYVDAALYDPTDGFFARGRGAGRAGRDFVTSPEVGPLFGALVARALDRWWEQLGRPDPFLVVDAGAGSGRLAADIVRATPACAPALRLVLVERSALLREEQRRRLELEPVEDALGPAVPGPPGEAPEPVRRAGPILTALDELPALGVEGVVLANELLDNLPFRLVERADDGWQEVRVATGADGGLAETLVPPPDDLAAEADELAAGVAITPGTRLPVPTGTAVWLAECAARLRHGFLVVVDYADDVASLASRGQRSWLRTYREHRRGHDPLEDPGACDITCDVVVEHLRLAAARVGLTALDETDQAVWLRELGIDELVEDARRVWRERAHLGDLEAVAARSRVTEAEALTEPGGLGAHRVFVFAKGVRR